ncbi:DUF4276 family protein [Ralstonia flatus]|uniref:DUF4276 family protein n=1 Tax=Ralstonia flatus TaxID=3058601 RepID=A0AAD2F824_9RALS|nr:DUF4276 family protein [Ralstonia sp. LMG 32965]MBN6211226.1 DUF4276 family protein [Ralstonia pickettii]CAJ0859879.1 hypothetical protein R77567_01405 [Ralstonia sp. LMG 32965]CAJ0867927.1 hypothetical protein R77564_01422 [Ralstonia sp. LMG 32965]
MRKIAFFVEGRTELHFVARLLQEVATKDHMYMDLREIRGGGKSGKTARTVTTIDIKPQMGSERFYALIFDCGSDAQVKTRIAEEHSALTKDGYEVIVGIRDVRPDYENSQLAHLRKLLRYGIDKTLTPVMFILPTAEIEAWFLAEHTHFGRIDPSLTMPQIQQAIGCDPATDDMSTRLEPAVDLDKCYRLVGKAYKKSKARRTINALDMSLVYVQLVDKIPELNRLVLAIDTFLTPAGNGQAQMAAS